jgi:hypothetical protein
MLEIPEGKGPLVTSRCRREDNIKKISITGMGSWNGLIWLRVGTGKYF